MPDNADISGAKRVPVLLFVLFLLFCITFGYSEPAEARLILNAIPDSTEFYLNGLEKQPDDENSFIVEPGPLLFEIKQRRVVVYSALFTIDSAEQKTIRIDCLDDCALLHVISEPVGATLSMNGTVLGTTPYMNRFLKSGSHSIMVTLPGHIPVIRRINLTNDSSQIFSYQMEPTQAVKDSISAVRRAMRRKRQAVQGTIFGGLGLAMTAAGAYYDLKAYNYLVKAQEASDAYEAARSPEECRKQRDLYDNNRHYAERPIFYRNVLYGAAGVCLISFYLSFVF